jgi:hypothetical protein
MLRWAFDHIPPNFDKMQQDTFEYQVVKGFYSLHAYASQFWADHIRIYVEECGKIGRDVEQALIEELSKFCRVHKNQGALLHASMMPDDILAEGQQGLDYLTHFKRNHCVYIFLSECIRFRRKAVKEQLTSKSIVGKTVNQPPIAPLILTQIQVIGSGMRRTIRRF